MKEKDIIRQSTGLVSRNTLRELLKKFLEEDKKEKVEWETLTRLNGLPHHWIYDLFRDRQDQIWIGTWGGGLGLYDGKKFRSFTTKDGLLSNSVTSIQEDKKGWIWIATDKGLNVLRDRKIEVAGLRGKSLLNIIIDSKGNLWAGCWRAYLSGGGLFKYDGKMWQSFSTSNGLPGMEILKVFEDSQGNIWVGTYEQGAGAGVGSFDGKSWKIFTKKEGLMSDCIYSMFEDPEGSMWFGTIQGISIFDKKRKWHHISSMNGLVDDRIYCMYIDSKKKMWFGTEGGISRHDGKEWTSYTKSDGLVENLVRCVVEDKEGNIWFGTYPYERGNGGISIAKYTVNTKGLAEKMTRYLPETVPQKYLKK
jgi:ligand-binding sensor domain-containing protein